MASVTVTAAGARALRRRHPWVFSRAVATVSGDPGSGDTVDILLPDGKVVAQGAYSPASQIRVRVWTFDPDEVVGEVFFRRRLERAVAGRRNLLDNPELTACRLVNAESDGLPGVVVDRYGDFLVCQLLAAGAERFREELGAALVGVFPCSGVFERSDVEVRAKEGLPVRTGRLWGAEPPELVEIREGGLRFLVDLRGGHKTGFYLDQRVNRVRLAAYGRGTEVLNCFAYTGAFAVAALAAGADRVVNVDTSAQALELARRHLVLNRLDPTRVESVEGSVFTVLRALRDRGRAFDLVILDPPKFADSRAQLAGACRGYKDVNLLACKLLRPGGMLFTFSCSGLVSADLFQKIVADAALDAGREAQVVERLGQADDHPTALPFPEGTYLKGLVCRVG